MMKKEKKMMMKKIQTLDQRISQMKILQMMIKVVKMNLT
jgi:hypothetical protein